MLNALIAPLDIYFITDNVKKLVIFIKIIVLLVIKLMNIKKVVHHAILDIIYCLMKIKLYVVIAIIMNH